MSDDYFDLVSIWHLDAPVDQVWRELTDARRWPDWWSFVENVEQIESGEPDGLHSLWRHAWRTLLPYRLDFLLRIVRIEAPRLLEAQVSGDLAGLGRCCLEATQTGTILRFDWRVRACKPWMRWLAPWARPLFLWNHKKVMQSGERQLRARLSVPKTSSARDSQAHAAM